MLEETTPSQAGHMTDGRFGSWPFTRQGMSDLTAKGCPSMSQVSAVPGTQRHEGVWARPDPADLILLARGTARGSQMAGCSLARSPSPSPFVLLAEKVQSAIQPEVPMRSTVRWLGTILPELP